MREQVKVNGSITDIWFYGKELSLPDWLAIGICENESVSQLWPIICVHGILHVRTVELVAISISERMVF